jgi:hypothetical protein
LHIPTVCNAFGNPKLDHLKIPIGTKTLDGKKISFKAEKLKERESGIEAVGDDRYPTGQKILNT